MIGCLILHGFSGTPDEIEVITTHYEKENWLVYTPILPGHGSKDGLKGVTYKHWIYAATVAAEELLKRCEKVYVIGFSMGGMIASFIAAKYPIDKLVLLSTSAYYINPKQIVQDITGWIVEDLKGELDDDKMYQFYKEKVKNTPILAAKEFATMVRLLRTQLKHITVPTLIVQGGNDGLVPPKKSAEYIYEQIQSEEKKLYFFPKARHYIWYGEDKDALLEVMDDFLLEEG